jgi:peptidoglycan hydrolase-like protein with peptidoglycan-binding domain
MKRLLLALVFLGLSAAALHADEQIRAVQQALHDEGFFLGEINGEPSKDFDAAIKRYQLRNGMVGTGQLTDEVIQALGLGAQPPAPAEPQPAPAEPAAPPQAGQPRPPYNLRREEPIENEPAPAPAPRRPSGPPMQPFYGGNGRNLPPPGNAAPNPVYSDLYWGTPFATAPEEVQRKTLIDCQTLLKSRNVYRGEIDGVPGPRMTDALRWYQKSARLPVTGRLDMPTLSGLRLLPGAPGAPRMQKAEPGERTRRGPAPESF